MRASRSRWRPPIATLRTAATATGTFDVYGYSIAVDPTKTVESITLPNDANVKILSIATQATLDAPTNLTATAAVNGNINLTWTASDSTVTGYNVYRYTLGSAASPTLLSSGSDRHQLHRYHRRAPATPIITWSRR